VLVVLEVLLEAVVARLASLVSLEVAARRLRAHQRPLLPQLLARVLPVDCPLPMPMELST
jgi:hypothetical protein